MEEVWRSSGGGLEELWRRSGGGVEEVWRRSGGGLNLGLDWPKVQYIR